MDLTRAQRIGVAAAIVCIIGAVAVGVRGRYLRARPAATGPLYTEPSTPAVPATITVHVAGAVNAPGVKVLARGARVIDAVQAAGGYTMAADETQVNLAAPLEDGERVDIPFRQAQPPSPPPGADQDQPPTAALTSGPLNLNTATAEELQALPGIGPALAADIVEYRLKVGSFRRVDDLLAVPGIGPKRLAEIRSLVRVQ
jgi:competence protein ComEA